MRSVNHGALYLGNNRCLFRVWAPQKKEMVLHLVHPENRELQMEPAANGCFELEVNGAGPGTRYFFRPDGSRNYPDPASQHQPGGVHEASEVVDHSSYAWQDQHWRGLPLKDLVLYELHVGTFTPEGTFEAIIPRLPALAETGVNALELMPVNQFPGNRNWGYDGVYPYAVQNSYGGPTGLKKLVDACHSHGIAVFLDVVYNHQGPEGNYLSQFGPYFTDKYHTPWGDAINLDGEYSDEVREFYARNALHWFENYHIDGLRIDAIHAMFDSGAVPFWEFANRQVQELAQKLGKPLHMIAESDFNSPRVTQPPEVGGYGFTAQWLDDFHHALYVLLDPKGRERYIDFGQMEQLAKAYTDGFVHSGEYVNFRKRKHGASSAGIRGDKFVIFNQNHDQIGNRVKGERLSVLTDFERLKIAAAALLLAPYIPMLFMGEEYAEDTPFLYFVSHSDTDLIKAVQEGREKEFAAFGFDAGPPDPQAEETFAESGLQWQKREHGKHQIMLNWHRHLIRLRQTHPVLQNFSKNDVRAYPLSQAGFILHRQAGSGRQHLLCLFNLSDDALAYTLPTTAENWTKILDSKEAAWLEPEKQGPALPPGSAAAGQTLSLPAASVTVYEANC